MIQTCEHCGAVNAEQARLCSFCEAPLPQNEEPILAPEPVSAPVEGNLAVEPDWRQELARRLEAFRARRRRLRSKPSHPPLPFDEEENGPFPDETERWGRPPGLEGGIAPGLLRPDKRNRIERVEIEVSQAELNFNELEENLARPQGAAEAGSAALPVAGLGQRRRAGLLDAMFLVLAYAGVLVLFGSLGGHFNLRKFDVGIGAAALALFYALYFGVFTVLGGVTPGMLLCRLRVVRFDGGAPDLEQLLWRSFGYFLSGGTALLGYLWALWDEDHLTWQDRISQTYLVREEALDAAVGATPERAGQPGNP